MSISKDLRKTLGLGLAAASVFAMANVANVQANASQKPVQPKAVQKTTKAQKFAKQHAADVAKFNAMRAKHSLNVAKYNAGVARHQVNVLKFNNGRIYHQMNVEKIQLRQLRHAHQQNTAAYKNAELKLQTLTNQHNANAATEKRMMSAHASLFKQTNQPAATHVSPKAATDPAVPKPDVSVGQSGEAFEPANLNFAPRQIQFYVNGQPLSKASMPTMLSNSISDNVSLIDTYMDNYLGHQGLYTTNLQLVNDLMNSKAGQPIRVNLKQGNGKQALRQLDKYDQSVLAMAHQEELLVL